MLFAPKDIVMLQENNAEKSFRLMFFFQIWSIFRKRRCFINIWTFK